MTSRECRRTFAHGCMTPVSEQYEVGNVFQRQGSNLSVQTLGVLKEERRREWDYICSKIMIAWRGKEELCLFKYLNIVLCEINIHC